MRFKQWLEANWDYFLPKDELRYNKGAVDNFVEQMADFTLNAQAVFALLTRQVVSNKPRYIGKIGGNFLNFDDPRLKEIKGQVSADVLESHFKFFHSGERAGNIEIVHPPVVYDEYDKHALFGVVVHELRHAQDWLAGYNFKNITYDFDIDLYLHNNLVEARAYADELKQLYQRVGNKQKIMSAFNQGIGMRPLPGAAYLPANLPHKYRKESPFSLSPNLLKFAEELLSLFEKNAGIKEDFSPVPIVRSFENQHEMAAKLVSQIINKLLFRNFLVKV